MAVDPKKKAKVLAEWAKGGISERDLAAKHKVSKSTVDRWIGETKKGQNGAEVNPKVNRYMETLERFGCAAMEMNISHAELLTDQNYVRNQKPEDIIALSKHINAVVERFIQLHRPVPTANDYAALPSASGGEALVPELVEEDCEEGVSV